jgi:hypothetical protein
MAGRPHARGVGAKTRGGVAERSSRDTGPMFKLGYLFGVALVALVIALPILLILGLDQKIVPKYLVEE